MPGEGVDRLGPAGLLEVGHGLGGEVGVVGRQRGVAALGHDVGAGGAAATPSRRPGRVVGGDGGLVGERVEVAADGRGGQAEQAADLGRGHGAVLGHGGEHALARALLVAADKHHTIVT